MVAIRFIEFMVFWLSSSCKCAVVYTILSQSESDDFSLRYGDFMVCSRPMAAVRHPQFLKFRVYVITLSPCCFASMCKIHWNRTISCRVMAKNNLFKWRPSAMLNYKIFIFGHVTHRILCTKFLQNRMNFFVEIWRFYDLQYGGRPPSWILWVQ